MCSQNCQRPRWFIDGSLGSTIILTDAIVDAMMRLAYSGIGGFRGQSQSVLGLC
ncbi:MAG: hypothetical protein KOO62_07500 [candidate division Zixibacteria bacterium]|nr:hypothetical protein [candidate division Zixibacteria bacterium]